MKQPDLRLQTIVNSLDRINLRLSSEMFRSIDAARGKRPGNVSRNTWIAEAIEEKIARESDQPVLELTQRAANE
ncbi:MAG: hypothetical protein KUL86_14450 [Castellaniella sp.]|nr:hypothetical protein [Castellaniella sp.]